MTHTFKPDSGGYLIINSNGSIKPGDTVYLSGNFKAVAIYNLVGSAEAPIKVTNVPGEVTIIGNINWSGGAWPHGLACRGCRFLEVFGDVKTNFKIVGSNSSAKDSNGYSVRAAYWNFMITELSDNFKVHSISIEYGGTGIICKTDVVGGNSKTWFPNTYLENFIFYNIDISNTQNEAMYIGHTATYWNIRTNQPFYGATSDVNTYKQPVKIKNLKIFNCNIANIGNDAIQIAAADNVEVFGNKIKNWALNKDSSHNGGILIGGRVVNFHVHDNIVMNGWGEFMQIYADAGTAIVERNLFVKNGLSGISLRGTKGLLVKFLNNTIISAGEAAFRINGYSGSTESHLLSKNIIAGYKGKAIYLENGGKAEDRDNKVFASVDVSALDAAKDYVSPPALKGYGYEDEVIDVPEPENPEPPAPTKKKLAGVVIGGYEFDLYDDGSAQSKKI